MRKQTNNDLRTIYNEKDMLEGNINRMCVTDDMDELLSMKNFAMKRIERIFQVNYERLTAESEGEQ